MKWLAGLFKKKSEKVKESHIDGGPELPDEIEIPWDEAANILNNIRLVAKTESEFASFLFQTKKREKEIFATLEMLENNIQEKIAKLREERGIPPELEGVEYEFILPEATGKSGKFLKVKKQE